MLGVLGGVCVFWCNLKRFEIRSFGSVVSFVGLWWSRYCGKARSEFNFHFKLSLAPGAAIRRREM